MEDIPSSKKVPPLLSFRSSQSFIIFAVCLAVFTDVFLYGVIIPVLPFALTERANVDEVDVQRWVSVLLAVQGGALLIGSPIFGYLADHTKSRRRLLLGGLICLASATIILCFARSLEVLVIARFLQGISASIVYSVGLALLTDTVGPENVGVGMGWIALATSAGTLAGPLVGGLVYAHAGYYSVFVVACGLILVDIVLRIAMIERKELRKWVLIVNTKALDSTTPLLSSGYTLRNATILGEAVSIISNDSKEALPHGGSNGIITILTTPRLLAILWGGFVYACIITCPQSVLPLYVNKVFGWTSQGAGLIFVPIAAPTLLSPLTGHLCDRYGSRWPAALGFFTGLPCFILLGFIRDDSVEQIFLLCALLVVVGLIIAMVDPALLSEISRALDDIEAERPGTFGVSGAYAQAYALFAMWWAAGTMVGPLWAGFLQEHYGWRGTTLTLGLLCGITAIPTALLLRNASHKVMSDEECEIEENWRQRVFTKMSGSNCQCRS